MGSFPESMNEYKKQLKRGYIQEAYQGFTIPVDGGLPDATPR